MKTSNHPDRLPPFAGGCNFRDLGGYETKDGRHVATGKVYRSGTLAELTPEDHKILSGLGIRSIFDFRSTRERTHRPSSLPANADFKVWHRDHHASAADLYVAIASPGADSQTSRRMLNEFYRTLPYEQAESYRALFLGLAAGELPALFHCSAGKDRTGGAAALLLDLLGVPRETVIEDYSFTDHFFDRLVELVSADPESNRLTGIDPELWKPMVYADRLFIETMFETIETRHGSAEGFLRDEIKLDDSTLAAIRERLLV